MLPDSAGLRCYGTAAYDRLPECDRCVEHPWCRAARDPKPLTGPNAGPTGDDAAYEAALNEAQAEPEARARADGNERALARAIVTLAQSCGESADRLAAVVLRMAGRSYAAIGRSTGKSRQAVAKDIASIEARAPALARLLRREFVAALVLPREPDALLRRYLAARGPRQRCPMAVWATIAAEFGVSVDAARARVRRRLNGGHGR